jgi:chemotaxis signal transduction protein
MAAPAEASAAVCAGQRALLIPVGDDTYALPLERVREVVVAPRVTELPTAPPVLLGVFNLRGEIVPLFDTGRLLGLRSMEEGRYAVVVDTEHGAAGLAATGMPLTVRLGEAAGPSDIEATTETFLVEDRRLAVALDLAALLRPTRIAR